MDVLKRLFEQHYQVPADHVKPIQGLGGSGRAIIRLAVTIGPEHGTVGPQQVKEAAKEAVQGVGFDMLVVCGFAFDPHVEPGPDCRTTA